MTPNSEICIFDMFTKGGYFKRSTQLGCDICSSYVPKIIVSLTHKENTKGGTNEEHYNDSAYVLHRWGHGARKQCSERMSLPWTINKAVETSLSTQKWRPISFLKE